MTAGGKDPEVKGFRLNEFILSGLLPPGFTTGMTREQISDKLSQSLDKPVIDTPDVDVYIIDLADGVAVELSFDKEQLCYDISISAKYNENIALLVEIDGDDSELT